MQYQLYTREFIPSKANAIVKLISAFLLKSVSGNKRAKRREILLKRISQYNGDKTLHTVAIEITKTIKQPLPVDLMENFVQMQFENAKFSCFEKWDEYLQIKYGNYMSLPPENEREWRHHPVIIDFVHNLEEISS